MIRIDIDPFPSAIQLDGLWLACWGSASGEYAGKVLSRSLVHLGAFDEDRIIGFVNVAWDGGDHAFLTHQSCDVLFPVFARIATHNALHRGIGFERRAVDTHGFARK